MSNLSMVQALSGVGSGMMAGQIPGLLELTSQPLETNSGATATPDTVSLAPLATRAQPQTLSHSLAAAPLGLAGLTTHGTSQATQLVKDITSLVIPHAQETTDLPAQAMGSSVLQYISDALDRVVAADKWDMLQDIGVAFAVVAVANGAMIGSTRLLEKHLDAYIKKAKIDPILKQRLYAAITMSRGALIAATMITSGVLVSDSVASTATGVLINVIMASIFLPKIVALAWNKYRISSNNYLEPGNYVKIGESLRGYVLFTGPESSIIVEFVSKEKVDKEMRDSVVGQPIDLADENTVIFPRQLLDLLKTTYPQFKIVKNADISGAVITPYPGQPQLTQNSIRFLLGLLDPNKEGPRVARNIVSKRVTPNESVEAPVTTFVLIDFPLH